MSCDVAAEHAALSLMRIIRTDVVCNIQPASFRQSDLPIRFNLSLIACFMVLGEERGGKK